MSQNKTQENQIKKLEKLKFAYREIFEGPYGKQVLADLIDFCYISKSTYVPNSDETIRNEGKREVFLYINRMAGINIAKLKKEVKDV